MDTSTDSSTEKTEQSMQSPVASPTTPKQSPKKGLMQRLSEIGTISPKEVVEFTRHIAVMLEAGVTIFEAVKFLRNQSKNKVFKVKLDSILESLNNGQPLSVAMHKFPKVFPDIYVNIVHVGEESGTLPKTMGDLADHMEESAKFKSRVKGALIYPKIIFTIVVIFMFVVLLFVMPRILSVFESLGAEVPLATRIMIQITKFANNNVVLLVAVIFGLIVIAYVLSKNPSFRKFMDKAAIKTPFVGHIVLNYNTTQVSQHFGTLFASGITLLKCLEITSTVIKNHLFREEVEFMVNRIRSGVSFSQSFKENSVFPPMFVKLINVGERTGKLPQVIDYLKNYYKGLVDEDVKNITAVIEPMIMVVLGLMVAGLVVTVIGPIYQLISDVSQ